MKFIISILAVIFYFSMGQATTLFLETEVGSGFGAGHLGMEWSKQKDFEDLYLLDANVSAGGSQSKSENTSTGEITVYKNQDVDAGFGIGFREMIEIHISGYSTKSPEAKFSQSGSSAELSFHYKLNSETDSDLSLESNDEKFSPSFSLGIGTGSSRIRQTISFTILNTLIERDIDFDQREVSGFVSVRPMEWLKLRLSGSSYSYSKTKEELQTAFNNRFLNYYSSDLVSTIGGLPESSVSLQGIFSINEDLDLEVRGASTKLIVDDSISKRGRVVMTKYFDTWSAGLGLSRSETAQSKEFTGLGNFSYDF